MGTQRLPRRAVRAIARRAGTSTLWHWQESRTVDTSAAQPGGEEHRAGRGHISCDGFRQGGREHSARPITKALRGTSRRAARSFRPFHGVDTPSGGTRVVALTQPPNALAVETSSSGSASWAARWGASDAGEEALSAPGRRGVALGSGGRPATAVRGRWSFAAPSLTSRIVSVNGLCVGTFRFEKGSDVIKDNRSANLRALSV